jgi:hypothetical protein
MSFDITISNEKETQFTDDQIVAFNRSHAPFKQDNDFVSLNFHIKDKKERDRCANALVQCGKNQHWE